MQGINTPYDYTIHLTRDIIHTNTMAKKRDLDIPEKVKFWNEIGPETTQTILAIFAILLTILFLLAPFDKAGPVGRWVLFHLTGLFGIGYYLIPIILIMFAVTSIRGIKRHFELSKGIGSLVLFVSALGLIHIVSTGSGGVAGKWIAMPLVSLVSTWASMAILITLVIVSVFIILEASFTLEQLAFWKWFRKDKEGGKNDMDENEEAAIDKAVAAAASPETARKGIDSAAPTKTVAKKDDAKNKKNQTLPLTDDEDGMFSPAVQAPLLTPFVPPPLSLLEKDRGKPETGDIKYNANIIKRTLQNFGITVEMDEISIGPSVTRYSLKPAEGVKLSRIVALNNDLSLALAAHPIRIEAPIPGKSLVGIEVPNTAKTTVGLASILSSPDYQDSDKPLLASLGKDITGNSHFCNIGKAPHMLIAGTTGSGKSVAIHALITSLLYRNSPESLKFIMIDPKRVELTLYNKIPHLLTPVITDPKKAILALKWAAKEMSRRYDVLEKNAIRDIDSYHRTVLGPAVKRFKALDPESRGDESALPETMPYLMIVIDELADIMQAYPRELESAIVRLAQMSRAVGIHLIVSTQRPSVNVITGLIKANIPTRVALQVSSQIDSRTILDQMGAEKLLGAGDMLYLGGEMSKPVRLQSAFISESEVKRVVKFLADQYKDEIMGEISLTAPEAGYDAAFNSTIDLGSDSLEDEDELYEAAREAIIAAGKASTSYRQRKLGVGYSRAAKLMDLLEEHGVIGPANGSKPREVTGGEQAGDSAATEVPPNASETNIS